LQYDDTLLSTDWDAAWESAVARTDHGWSVELRLPLRAFRIPDGASEFGLNVVRTRTAHHEESVWRFTPRGTPRLMSPLGRAPAPGSRAPPPRRSVEIRPYVATMLSHDSALNGRASGLTDACSAIGVANGTITKVCVGIDFKLGLTSELSLIGAINADFGQT